MPETETKICGIPGGGRWVLLTGQGGGGFLDPPGSAQHTYAFAEYRGSRSADYETFMGIRGVLSESWVPAPVKARARQLLASNAVECSEEWVRSVYAYFRNCYSPDGENRNASDCLIPREGDPVPAPELHLAYLHVRSFFPDHEPRTDLISDPPAWGKS